MFAVLCDRKYWGVSCGLRDGCRARNDATAKLISAESDSGSESEPESEPEPGSSRHQVILIQTLEWPDYQPRRQDNKAVVGGKS
jgi:hypothetical protein